MALTDENSGGLNVSMPVAPAYGNGGGYGNNGGNGSSGGSSKKGVNTGDDQNAAVWLMLMLAAMAGTAGMAYTRKRKGE